MLHTSRRTVRSAYSGVVVTLIMAIAVLASSATIASPAQAADCGGVETSIISGDVCAGADKESTDSGKNPVVSVLTFVMQVLTGAVGIAAVGALIYAGILYAAAGGDSSQVQKSKTLIKDTVIGIVCYAGMILILNFVIPGGVFGQQSTTGGGTAPAPSTGTPGDETTPAPVAGACYWKQYASAPGGKFYHRSGSISYAFENSPEGILYADSHGYDRIDLDLQLTKDGVVVATHTAAPLGKDRIWAGFRDPTGKITNTKVQVKDLTFAEVSRLKHKDGYRIYSLEHLIGVAAKTKLSLYLELKTPKSLKSHLPEIAAMLNKAKMKAVIAGQTTHAGQKAALSYASQLGFWARNITAQTWTKPNKNDSLCRSLEG